MGLTVKARPDTPRRLEPARLKSDRVQKKTDAQLKTIFLEGSGKMKPRKDLSETDINSVIAYIRNFRKK